MPSRKKPPAPAKPEVVGKWVDELDYRAKEPFAGPMLEYPGLLPRPVKLSRIKFGVFRASIHRLVGAGKDQWFLTCDPFIRARHLGTDLDSLTALKDKATVELMDMLTTASEQLGRAVHGGTDAES